MSTLSWFCTYIVSMNGRMKHSVLLLNWSADTEIGVCFLAYSSIQKILTNHQFSHWAESHLCSNFLFVVARAAMQCWRVRRAQARRCACCVQRWHGVRALLLFLFSLAASRQLSPSRWMAAGGWISVNLMEIRRRRRCRKGCPQLCIPLALTASCSRWSGSSRLHFTG